MRKLFQELGAFALCGTIAALCVIAVLGWARTAEVSATSDVPRYLMIDGTFVRFEVNGFTPDSAPEVALRNGTRLEVFIRDADRQFPDDFGDEGLENPTDPVIVRLVEHRVVTIAERDDATGRLTHLAQYEGTSPFIRRTPQDQGGFPVYEYFVAVVEE